MPKPLEHWKRKTEARKNGLRPDGRAVRRVEQRTGLPPLRDLLSMKIVQLRSAIEASECWQDIHQILSEDGLQYELHGSGARISRTGGSLFMPAGQLGTGCSLKSLEGRLGEFTPADTTDAKTDLLPRERPTAANSSPLQTLMQSLARTVKEIKKWRRDRATARKALFARQKDERQRVGEILGGRRSLAARALRQVMTVAHREQAAELRLQHPAPHSVPFDATNHIRMLAPEDMVSRRYRHVHRAEKMTESIVIDGMSHDHTAYRQAWYAQPGAVMDIPRLIQNTIFRHSEDVRIDPRGNLLFARRNAEGSIVGFALRRSQDLFAYVDQPSGSGDGLCLIRSRSATDVEVVGNVLSALIRAAEWAEEPGLIIVAEPKMTPRTQLLLNTVRSSRTEALAEHTVPTQPKHMQDLQTKSDYASGTETNASESYDDKTRQPELENHEASTIDDPTPFAC